MTRSLLIVTATLALSCADGAGGAEVEQEADRTAADRGAQADVVVLADKVEPAGPDAGLDAPLLPDAAVAEFTPACAPGEGCLGDECVENDQCQSGWCVQHLGEGICTKLCQDECPGGWACKLVAGTDPDAVYICVSAFANLCKPCHASADCKSPGAEGACIRYDSGTSFCGGPCGLEGPECPWGFTCKDVETTEGVTITQCVADTGLCPCTQASVEVGLSTPCTVENEHGLCTGLRACTAEGLSPCDALVPALETCNGADDDCDGSTDEPLEVGGNYVNLCDDENECTTDTCNGLEGCSYETLNEGECKDGDSCTIGDHCEAGVCVGLPIVCDDANLCTDDSCDGLGGCQNLFNTAPCDDEDPCSVKDTCEDGSCTGYPVDCECKSDNDCLGLDDGDACNGTLVCDNSKLPYVCQVAPDSVIVCPEPEGVDAICQEASCAPEGGECGTVPDHEGFACDDGNACTIGDECADGICSPGVPTNCNDGNLCTDDSCEADSGCTHAPNMAPCFDGDFCTLNDVCADGECMGGETADCNDDNPCTDDSCEPEAGCTHVPNMESCSDENACTEGDHCLGGACIFAAILDCSDDNICTDDSCDSAGGCVNAFNTHPCSDVSLCTAGDVCDQGLCVSGADINCDDGNICTDDGCAAESGCVHISNDLQCDDGNKCTETDLCVGGKCSGSTPPDCADSSVCTTDLCDPQLGCVHTLNSAPCDDADVCTSGDKCDQGACVPGPTMECDDGNVCTLDDCDAQTGCEHDKVTAFTEVPGCSEACMGCQEGFCSALPDGSEDAVGPSTCGDDSGTCYRCLDGACTHQTSGQDLWGECATAPAPGPGSCRSDNCSGEGFECGMLPEGEAGQPACHRCPGNSYNDVKLNDNEQDIEGDALCDDLCRACQAGACGNASAASDPGDQCEAAAEQQTGGAPNHCQERTRDGKCDGSGACNDFGDWFSINDGQQCSATPICVGDVHYAIALCNDGACSQGGGETGCCGDSVCAEDKHCDLDSNECVNNYPQCQGWEYNGYCWYFDNSDSYEYNCDELCQAHGAECLVEGRIEEASNTECTVCRHWFPNLTCSFAQHDESAKPCTYTNSKCEYASYTPAVSECAGPKYGTATHRFCSCTF